MAKPVKLAHVVYMTRRFDEMVNWYASVFEASIIYRNPALAFLTYDDEHHRFAFANLDVLRPAAVGADDRGAIGVNHVGFTYAGIGDLLLTYDRLKKAGVHHYWAVHHGTTLSLYYKDPDGNRMEFQVDCGTVEQANAYMASEAFAANPVGVRYEPDRLLAKYRAGVSPEDLMRMPQEPASDIPLEHGMT
jgi:catechol-2,3-dioxygenase